jgi:hypothetical protein
MIKRGIATFTLDSGKCPKWLFDRMVSLGSQMIEIIVEEYGPDEFIQRISDPVWFQALGTVLAFDWNASGLTTILTGALKQAIKGKEKSLGIFICGGKGKTSLKTPDEINAWGEQLSLPESEVKNLVYNSKTSAKVDSCLVQDGYQLYHHAFFFSKNGKWTVVQQGMNTENTTARRYHWYSDNIKDIVCEPHSGIVSQIKSLCLDLTAKESGNTRKTSTDIVSNNNYSSLIKDINIIRKYATKNSKMVSFQNSGEQLVFLELSHDEFYWHPVVNEDFSKSKYLEKILWVLCDRKPENYEKILITEGVGPKTIRALSLVSEVIYGAKPSYQDPARYSFAHGGKDATPYPVDIKTYDSSIEFFRNVIRKIKASPFEKEKLLKKINT